jgi:hypothetical protein
MALQIPKVVFAVREPEPAGPRKYMQKPGLFPVQVLLLFLRHDHTSMKSVFEKFELFEFRIGVMNQKS